MAQRAAQQAEAVHMAQAAAAQAGVIFLYCTVGLTQIRVVSLQRAGRAAQRLVILPAIPLAAQAERVQFKLRQLLNSQRGILVTSNEMLLGELKEFRSEAKVKLDRKSTRLNSSHSDRSRMPSSA